MLRRDSVVTARHSLTTAKRYHRSLISSNPQKRGYSKKGFLQNIYTSENRAKNVNLDLVRGGVALRSATGRGGVGRV